MNELNWTGHWRKVVDRACVVLGRCWSACLRRCSASSRSADSLIALHKHTTQHRAQVRGIFYTRTRYIRHEAAGELRRLMLGRGVACGVRCLTAGSSRLPPPHSWGAPAAYLQKRIETHRQLDTRSSGAVYLCIMMRLSESASVAYPVPAVP